MGAPSWLDGLPAELAPQQRLLRALLRWCELDADVRWLVVGCSFARGNADALSDLDLAIGVTDTEVEATARRLADAAGELGELVECFDHALRPVAGPHRRVFAQYADRTQLDVVVLEASNATLPGTIVLYDPAGLVVCDAAPIAPSWEQVRSWACLAWEVLANVGKYVRRGSPWEAHGSLETARGLVWRLWALVRDVPEPQYGITSLLDSSEPPELPEEMESTVAGLDLDDILAASLRLARQLARLQDRLAATEHPMPVAFGEFVLSDLEVTRPAGRC